jgi:hypothetical protein
MPHWTRKGSANHVAQQHRRREALELYQHFHSYAEVARRMGTTRSAVYKMIHAALVDIVATPAEAVRKLEMEHLDQLTAKAMNAAEALKEKPERVLEAIRTAVIVSERRAKLLGLDAEQKFAVTNTHALLTATPLQRLQLYINRGTKREHWPAELQEYAERLEQEGKALPEPGWEAPALPEGDEDEVEGEIVGDEGGTE